MGFYDVNVLFYVLQTGVSSLFIYIIYLSVKHRNCYINKRYLPLITKCTQFSQSAKFEAQGEKSCLHDF